MTPTLLDLTTVATCERAMLAAEGPYHVHVEGRYIADLALVTTQRRRVAECRVAEAARRAAAAAVITADCTRRAC
jgi:hypothetical protein